VKKIIIGLTLTFALAACASVASKNSYTDLLVDGFSTDFKSKGSASIDRVIHQDEVQKVCSQYPLNLTQDQEAILKAGQLKTVKYPRDSNYLGDWKEGEKVALDGKGMQSSDAIGTVNGGNCYACHQITKQEISYGNLGPSLYRYRQVRGSNQQTIKYTWEKLFNSQAHRACSSMPRFGYSGILTEKQIKDVMAFLLDPASPVNQ
jgi:L-cysteine S-thiosulfotransferase